MVNIDKSLLLFLPCNAVAGLSKQQLAALQGQADSTTASPAAPDVGNRDSSTSPAAAAVAAARHSSLLRSLPVAVLADPSPSRPQAGVVLSVAPLLGARPYTDHQVGKWLHVHVRPSVRGLLRIIKVCAGVMACVRRGGGPSQLQSVVACKPVFTFKRGLCS